MMNLITVRCHMVERLRVGCDTPAHVGASFSYLGIHWTHYTEIWCVARPIYYAFYAGISGGYLQMLHAATEHLF